MNEPHDRQVQQPAQVVLYPPDWSKWRGVQVAALWEWAALSCNLEPRCLLQETRGTLPVFAASPGDKYFSWAFLSPESMEFQRRVDHARPHARKGAGLLAVEEDVGIGAMVTLDAFVKFARSRDWALPADFPAPLGPSLEPVDRAAPDADDERMRGQPWVQAAFKRADEICRREKKVPPYNVMADEVLGHLEAHGITGRGDKKVTKANLLRRFSDWKPPKK